MNFSINVIKNCFIFCLVFLTIMFTSCDFGEKNPVQPEIPIPSNIDESVLEELSAIQLTKVMGNGINLGNTMEAAGGSWLGFNNKPEEYEKAWGQPKTTKEIFEGYKAAGIDSVRIPVAWLNTMDIANGDYKINDDYIAYVSNIVKMAVEADLYVVLNDHWDYGWWSLFGHSEWKNEAYKIFDAVWDQVGTYFKDYPYTVIFEAGNEEWGEGFFHDFEINKKKYCENIAPNIYGIPDSEKQAFYQKGYDLIEEVGQYFVDKIRAQGGKNEKRFLLIPGFNTGFELTSDSRYKMPKDPTNSDKCKLLVSVHYYSPSPYAILSEDADWAKVAKTWGSAKDVSEQNYQFGLMQRFVKQGYGVIIGEYGVARLKNEDGSYSRKENDTLWIKNILDNCDKYNYCPMLWDCNGYFKKTGNIGFEDEDIAAVYKNRNYESEKVE